jgi:type VI secretion system protein ImpH
MGATVGDETDAVDFLAGLAEAPYRYDFYQTLRRLECLYPTKPRWGRALRPVDEPIRLGQDPDLSFAVASLASFETPAGRPPRLQVKLFGLLGPNGPLPIHITEYARHRLYNQGDPTLCRFLDIFHHRFLALFYQAWAQAQPHVNRDRPDSDRFAFFVGSFLGLAPASCRDRDAVPDVAKFFHAGSLIRHVRNVEGLTKILRHFFRVPVRIEEFVGHWLSIDPRERSQLGRESAIVGSGAVLGRQVWDRQHKFRIHLGPFGLAEYESFLPGGSRLKKLVDWVRLYLTHELDWDVRLRLEKAQVPQMRLGAGRRLGWTTWLGHRRRVNDADELCLNAESFMMTSRGPQ